jgi:LEA14-like dessication related protein
MNRRTGVITLCGFLLLLLPSCESARKMLEGSDKPTARVKSARVEDLRLDGIDLAFDVEVKNPYDVAIPLLGVDFALASGGKPFLKGSLDESGTIAAKGARVLPVGAAVAFADLLNLLSDVKPGAVLPYTLDLGVSVDAPVVGRLRLPVTQKGKLPVPTLPDIEVKGIELDKVSPGEVTAVLRLKIDNLNAFPLDLVELGSSFSLGGTPVADARSRKAVRFEGGKKGGLEIPISFSPLRAGMAVLGLLSGSEANYGLEGTLSTKTPFGALSMPFRVGGTAPLER